MFIIYNCFLSYILFYLFKSCPYIINVSCEINEFDLLIGEIYKLKAAEQFLSQIIEAKVRKKSKNWLNKKKPNLLILKGSIQAIQRNRGTCSIRVSQQLCVVYSTPEWIKQRGQIRSGLFAERKLSGQSIKLSQHN